MTGLELLCGLVIILLAMYYYLVEDLDFWKKRGIPGPKPVPLFGNFMNTILGWKSVGDEMQDYYRQYRDEPVFGLFLRRERALGINDPDIIHTILIKDFSNFVSRGLNVAEVAEPLSQHLFVLEPKRWRSLRSHLSPTFTTGKLKGMFTLILECAVTLENYLDILVAEGKPFDCRDLVTRYTTDVIGSCAFGIEMSAASKEESMFRKMGGKIIYPGWKQLLRLRIREAFPRFYNLLGYILPYDEQTIFFMKTVLEMIEHRKKNNIVRHDFINTLMELEAHPEKLGDIELTASLLVAQAFVFFAAGSDAPASMMNLAVYEMAMNQEIQNKLRKEIKEHEAINNGEWSSENIKKMLILDEIFKETLRKHPPVTVLLRKAEESYTFEDLKLTIPKNTRIIIPIYAIHNDPEIYPNPEVFDINRFTDDEVAKRHPMHYIPFGNGPRNCIGGRFAIFQVKIGMIKIFGNYKIDVCEETVPFENNPRDIFLAPKHKIMLKITKLTS